MRTVVACMLVASLSGCFQIARRPEQLPPIAEAHIDTCSARDVGETYAFMLSRMERCFTANRSMTVAAGITTITRHVVIGEAVGPYTIAVQRHSPGETSYPILVTIAASAPSDESCKANVRALHRWSDERSLHQLGLVKSIAEGSEVDCMDADLR